MSAGDACVKELLPSNLRPLTLWNLFPCMHRPVEPSLHPTNKVDPAGRAWKSLHTPWHPVAVCNLSSSRCLLYNWTQQNPLLNHFTFHTGATKHFFFKCQYVDNWESSNCSWGVDTCVKKIARRTSGCHTLSYSTAAICIKFHFILFLFLLLFYTILLSVFKL